VRDAAYHLIRRLVKVFIWHGRSSGRENLPASGPVVFIGNHCGPLGPIGCVSEVKLRLYPWIIYQMLDPLECPAYMQVDFVEKSLHLRLPLSAAVSRRLSKVVVPLLTEIGGIPVFKFQGPQKALHTLQSSLAHLLAGECLLILPEVPEWVEDPQTRIHKFSKSSLWLVDLYHQKTGRPLAIIPFVAHPTRHIRFLFPRNLTPPDLTSAGGREAWMAALEGEIRQVYLEMGCNIS